MSLIILDRDGVLNEIVIDPEQGTVDSPLHPSQVRILPGVPAALVRLRQLGFDLAIVTNQPAAAKGKTTRANLEAVHAAVLQGCGDVIHRSFICWHRAEDNCACRKPKPHMLFEALDGSSPAHAWMVGDGVTDVRAGQTAGVRTAFLGPRKCDVCKILSPPPDLWASDLPDFALQLAHPPPS